MLGVALTAIRLLAASIAATGFVAASQCSRPRTVPSPPTTGPYKGNLEYIQVQITSRVRTYFASVVGVRALTNGVEAVARSKPSVLGPLFQGASVVSLASTSDCLFNKAFYVHAEATLDISGSGILVNSGNPTCALITQGQGSIRIADSNAIRVVGACAIKRKAAGSDIT